MNRDKASDQLKDYAKANAGRDRMTTSHGCPMGSRTSVLTVGPRGPMLLQDNSFMDELAHFDRERIPERVVHAKGGGAFGYFEVTHDISRYCKAKVFSQIGKKTPVAVRFSTVGGESGSADTARDPRGFAVKFYTEDGIWDLVGNNTPIFFIRDPLLFPSFIHTQKRNPETHLKDPDMFWDFITLRPETCHQVSFLFSDRGIPEGWRYMNGYGSHTFKMVNADGKPIYCKFHFKTDQGIKNMLQRDADHLAGSDPDYMIRDLYNAIATGSFPSWTFYIQVMTFEQASQFHWNPFDVTKVWPHSEFPLIQVGKLVLNRNPKNYFVDIEQLAFAPSHLVPGIEPSPDKMLQGRLFSYADTHRHRLGANYLHIPVNRPSEKVKVANTQRDGPGCVTDNQQGTPNYYPNSFNGAVDNQSFCFVKYRINEDVAHFNNGDEDNYSQVGIFWRNVLNEEERNRLVQNMAGHLINAQPIFQKRAVENFSQADPEYGRRLEQELLTRQEGL